MSLGTCLEMVAPYYNLALVTIVVILFLILFKKSKKKKTPMLPWKIMFMVICIYIVEQILNVLFNAGVIVFPRILNAILEMFIITSFIYVLLSQIELIKK